MKKTISLTLALITLLLTLVSCTPTPDVPSTDPNSPNFVRPSDVEEEFQIANDYIIYNSFYYYEGKINKENNMSPYTLKYQNLNNLQLEALRLYNDVLDEKNDPFVTTGPLTHLMLIDKKATNENKGMPVLIIGLKYARKEINEERRINMYRIISFNTANNKLSVLADEIQSMNQLYLCNEKLYFTGKETEIIDDENIDTKIYLYSMDKDGKNLTRHSMPNEKTWPCLMGEYDNQLYFSYPELDQIYIADKKLDNISLYTEEIDCNYTPFFKNGYIHYLGDFKTTKIDSVDIKTEDIYRRPISKMLDPKTEEIVLDDIVSNFYAENNTLLSYFLLDDVQIQTISNSKKRMALNFYRMYDFENGTSEILLNRRDNNTNSSYNFILFSKKYYIYVKTNPLKEILVNRITGEEKEVKGIFY